MTPPLIAAALHLTATLAAENAALSNMDLAGAASLLADKTAAAAAFSAAQAAGQRPPRMAVPPGLHKVAANLQQAAEDNRRLLERAIAVQSRVIGTLAEAARTANASPRYGSSGLLATRSIGAWALRSQA